MARIKDTENITKKECFFIECKKEFEPEFLNQDYCSPKCRNNAAVRRYIVRNLSKYLPEYLLSKSDEELSKVLGSIGLRSYDRRKRFKVSEKIRNQHKCRQTI